MSPTAETKCWCRRRYATPTVLRIFHMSVAWTYFAGIFGYYDLFCIYPVQQSPMLYAGFWKYLTYWNLLSQFLFFTFSCVTDTILPSISYPNTYARMMKFRDDVYAGIVFPYGVFVSSMFWVLYTLDPTSLDPRFPRWLNHISHTVPVPVLLLETFIVHHRYPKWKVGFSWAVGFGCVYLIWILILAFSKGIWVYPVLEKLPMFGRAIFIVISIIIQILIYLVCEEINNCFWGNSFIARNIRLLLMCRRKYDYIDLAKNN